MKGTSKAMAAQNKNEARTEGKEFARMLIGLIERKKEPDYELLAAFASYCATNVVGYADADRSNAWASAFIKQWLEAPKAPAGDVLNLDTVNLLRQALGLPPLETPLPQLTDGSAS